MKHVSEELNRLIKEAIDNKTKPRGSLGRLEELAAQICRVQGTTHPELKKPTILVFAADHGLAREPIAAYPQEVTVQMAHNMVAGGAGINALCRQHGIEVILVDAGVDWPESRPESMIDHWVGPGTASSLTGDAMTEEQLEACLAAGAAVVDENLDSESNVVGFGELGIGNTSPASLLVSALAGISLPDCVGPGSGLNGEALAKKLEILQQVQAAHPQPGNAKEALRMFGGFEIAQMAGAMRRAYQTGRLLLIDGFVATSAFLTVWADDPSIIENSVFCHKSKEPGHCKVMDFLGVNPLVDLEMRLGEGTGCAVAYPILVSATTFLNDMANFADTGVSTGTPEAEDA